MKRREFLQLSIGTAAVAALSSHARAEAAPKEIRIGTQKGGFFPAVRQRHTIEDVFKPLGIESGIHVSRCSAKQRHPAQLGGIDLLQCVVVSMNVDVGPVAQIK